MPPIIEEITNWGFKVACGILLGLIGWFSSQVYLTMSAITKQFADMDKRVGGIEVSRAIYIERYLKYEALLEQVQKDAENLKQRAAVIESTLSRHRIY